MVVPAAALLIAIALVEATKLLAGQRQICSCSWVPGTLGALWFVYTVVWLGPYLFQATPVQIIAHTYLRNPYLQLREVGRYLAVNSSPTNRIAILQSEPEMLFYANRRSVTGYIYAYDITLPGPYRGEMEKQFKAELSAAQPDYVVFVNSPHSWMVSDEAGAQYVNWCRQFAHSNYDIVGVADIIDPIAQQTAFAWDSDARFYTNRSADFIEVLRRR
jgi:hypothetical protein